MSPVNQKPSSSKATYGKPRRHGQCCKSTSLQCCSSAEQPSVLGKEKKQPCAKAKNNPTLKPQDAILGGWHKCSYVVSPIMIRKDLSSQYHIKCHLCQTSELLHRKTPCTKQFNYFRGCTIKGNGSLETHADQFLRG